MYEVKKIAKDEQRTSVWSGGTTTEIAIFPPDANYSNRDFLWRLSTAVVEVEESTFTKLPGVDRHLMVLAGELKLIHQGKHTKVLQQYDQDYFKGDWDTTSLGKARDFNLMLRDGTTGSLQHVNLKEGQQHAININPTEDKKCFVGCYCYKGAVSVEIHSETVELNEGDLLLISYSQCLNIAAVNNQTESCNLINTFIQI